MAHFAYTYIRKSLRFLKVKRRICRAADLSCSRIRIRAVSLTLSISSESHGDRSTNAYWGPEGPSRLLTTLPKAKSKRLTMWDSSSHGSIVCEASSRKPGEGGRDVPGCSNPEIGVSGISQDFPVWAVANGPSVPIEAGLFVDSLWLLSVNVNFCGSSATRVPTSPLSSFCGDICSDRLSSAALLSQLSPPVPAGGLSTAVTSAVTTIESKPVESGRSIGNDCRCQIGWRSRNGAYSLSAWLSSASPRNTARALEWGRRGRSGKRGRHGPGGRRGRRGDAVAEAVGKEHGQAGEGSAHFI